MLGYTPGPATQPRTSKRKTRRVFSAVDVGRGETMVNGYLVKRWGVYYQGSARAHAFELLKKKAAGTRGLHDMAARGEIHDSLRMEILRRLQPRYKRPSTESDHG